MRKSKEAQRAYDKARQKWLRAHPEKWKRRLRQARIRYHAYTKHRFPNVCEKCRKPFRCSIIYQRCCSLKCALSGKDSPFWKTGRVLTGDGYVRIYHPNHPSVIGNHVLEHRLVMEHTLGRYLKPNEIVHHLNGNKLDNRPENLVVTSPSEHNHIHWKTTRKHRRVSSSSS